MGTGLIGYIIPEEMGQYLANFGWHFNKKMCEWAVGMMQKKDRATGKKRNITPIGMEELEAMLNTYGVDIDSNNRYDALYLANMVKADFLGSSIDDMEHLVKYVKDVLCDDDGYEGLVLNRFRADCDAKGKVIFWEKMI